MYTSTIKFYRHIINFENKVYYENLYDVFGRVCGESTKGIIMILTLFKVPFNGLSRQSERKQEETINLAQFVAVNKGRFI